MATKYRNQSPKDTSSFIDSGLGEEENTHHVDTYQDFEETLTKAIEEEASDGGSHSMLQESYDRELWRFEGKNVSKLTLKGIYGRSVSVSESTLTYSKGQDVPPECLENVRNRGEGKSDKFRQIYSDLADHLQGFKKAKDCYLLPIENGILISQKEITTAMDNIPGFISVEQKPRRGKVLFKDVALEATVSHGRSITYTRKCEDGGNFLVLNVIGKGCDGIVYKAMDVQTGDQFAVKRMEVTTKMLCRNPISAFLKLIGCEQTCRAYGVILDELDNCLYFLMELLDGKTLSDLLDKKSPPIGIPFAVDYTIDILKGLQYIHSKGLIHADIHGFNIMIVVPRAIIIDTTGARDASGPKSRGYLWDVANAIKLLNNMLSNSTIFSPPPWEASDEDRRKFKKRTLKKLEQLLKRQAKYLASTSPMIDNIDTLLQDLEEISKELEDTCLRSTSDSSSSSEDDADLPSKDTNQALKARLEASEAETMREREMRMKAEQDKKELQDELDALKAKYQEKNLE
ncbi:uncharacterized protein LOC144902315 isoform X2 [Branchiostoma floridae x Branchiostoma belcheri]